MAVNYNCIKVNNYLPHKIQLATWGIILLNRGLPSPLIQALHYWAKFSEEVNV